MVSKKKKMAAADNNVKIRRKSFLVEDIESSTFLNLCEPLEPSTFFSLEEAEDNQQDHHHHQKKKKNQNQNNTTEEEEDSKLNNKNINNDDDDDYVVHDDDDYLKRLRQATITATKSTSNSSSNNNINDDDDDDGGSNSNAVLAGTATVSVSTSSHHDDSINNNLPSSSSFKNNLNSGAFTVQHQQENDVYDSSNSFSIGSSLREKSTSGGGGSGGSGGCSSTTIPTTSKQSKHSATGGDLCPKQLMTSRETLKSEKIKRMSQERLRFDLTSKILHGRSKERKMLIDAFDECCYYDDDDDDENENEEKDNEVIEVEGGGGRNNEQKKHPSSRSGRSKRRNRQIVFILGISGTGKTSLANSITSYVKSKGGLIVRSKCDIYQRQQPFATISNSVREICGTLLYLKTTTTAATTRTRTTSTNPNSSLTLLQEFHKELIQTIDLEDLKLLIKICPELGEVIDNDDAIIVDDLVEGSTILELDDSKRSSKDNNNNNDGDGGGRDYIAKEEEGTTAASTTKTANVNVSSNDDATQGKMKLQQSLRILFRIFSKLLGPLVIVFDDIQWIDEASASMIQSLLLDIENSKPLLLIGIYRSDEVDLIVDDDEKKDDENEPQRHLITKLRNELYSKQDDYQFKKSEIKIKELTLSDTNHILMDLMSIDDDEEETTLSLAKICYKRTMGNPSFLLAFMKKLWEIKLLSFSFALHKWQWNLDDILAETSATTNVVELMKGSLMALPKNFQRKLSIAAFLGTRLQPSTINVVLEGLDNDSNMPLPSDDDIDNDEKEGGTTTQSSNRSKSLDVVVDDEPSSEDWLAKAEKMGLIEPIESSKIVITYQWVHDNVQEAAMSLIPPDELPALKRQIATILLAKLDKDHASNMVFVIANLLNEGSSEDDENTKLQRAELNLKAAQHASRYSAFDTSVKYAIQGIELLPEDRWEKHFDLSFDLYCTAVENGLPVGMNTQVQGLFEEVVAQDECSLVDKMRVYIPKIVYLAGNLPNGGDGEQGPIALIVSLLKQLGHRFPKGKFGQVVSIISGSTSLRKKLRKMSTDDVLKLPKMESEVDQAKMMLLLRLTIASYTSTEKIYLPLAICAMLRLTLEKGLSLYAPVAFACYSVIAIAVLDDFTISYKAGQMSEKLTNARARPLESRSSLYVNAFSRAWVDPVFSLDAGLLKTYRLGMSLGEVDSAMVAIYLTVSVGLQTGKSLRLLEADCRIYAAQMKEFKRTSILCFTITYWLAIVQLMGCQDTIPRLQGVDASMCFNDWLSVHKDDNTISAKVKSLMSFLFMIMGEHQKGADLAIDKGDSYGRTSPGHSWFMIDTFARAISLYAMARQSKARKYKTEGRRLHKKIKAWIKRGVPSVGHYEKILNAEWLVIKGNFDEAERWYQSAVALCSKSGFTGDAALANERFGLFFLTERNNEAEATYRLAEACKLYKEWGAERKVQAIREEYSYLWPQPSEIVLSK